MYMYVHSCSTQGVAEQSQRRGDETGHNFRACAHTCGKINTAGQCMALGGGVWERHYKLVPSAIAETTAVLPEFTARECMVSEVRPAF